MMNIIEAIEDPNLFGSLFKDQSTWINWKIFLKALFALPMDEKELIIYKKYTGRKRIPQSQFKEVFAIVSRRGGKSFISAVIACFLALFHDWSKFLSPGEVGWIMVIANDRNQARVILNYIKAILKLEMFKDSIEKELAWEIRLKNQIIVSIKTCDSKTIRGFTTLTCICDELAFWASEQSANPAKEILTAIRPALATIPGSLLLGISTPYSKTGPLHESFRDKYGQDDSGTLVWRAPTLDMNPTIPPEIIEKALKDDYSAAKAEWLAEFREDLETYIPSEMIEAATIPNRFELPKIEGAKYYAFTDPSGGSKSLKADSFTLAIAHKEKDSEKIILDRLEEKHPPFKPQDVTKEFSKVIKSYGLSRVVGDKYGGEWPSSAFGDEGILYQASKLDKSTLYLEFEPILAQGQVELLDNKRLFNQLRSLERRTRSGGKDSVDHPKGLHDDLANAVAGACVLAIEDKYARPEILVIDHGTPELEDWERKMIEAQEKKRKEYEDPPEIKALMNKETVLKFLELMRKHDNRIDEVAKEMGIESSVLRRWNQLKRDFIAQEAKIGSASDDFIIA